MKGFLRLGLAVIGFAASLSGAYAQGLPSAVPYPLTLPADIAFAKQHHCLLLSTGCLTGAVGGWIGKYALVPYGAPICPHRADLAIMNEDVLKHHMSRLRSDLQARGCVKEDSQQTTLQVVPPADPQHWRLRVKIWLVLDPLHAYLRVGWVPEIAVRLRCEKPGCLDQCKYPNCLNPP